MATTPPTTGYDMIRTLKLELRAQGDRRNYPDLVALTTNSDPFYVGSELDLEKARWFEGVWRDHGGQKGTHLRRLHYQLVVRGDSKKADGTPYENTEVAWSYLLDTSRVARALGLVDAGDLDDHRNPPPILAQWDEAEVTTPMIEDLYVPDFDLPKITTELAGSMYLKVPQPRIAGYDSDDYLDRGFIIECWVEKTTMNDILRPLCDELGVNLVPAAGIQSITSAVKLLKDRCAKLSKPARVFYISDHDPAGDIMPVAVARQLEFYRPRYAPDVEVKLNPIALTAEQAIGLPHVPIKESDLRRAGFEAIHGAGAVELDALEALRPGELARLVRTAIEPYLDHTIAARLRDAVTEAKEIVESEWDKMTKDIQDELGVIADNAAKIVRKYRDRLTVLNDELQEELAPLNERIKPLREKLDERIWKFAPEVPVRPEPEIDPPDESAWLFDSNRDYMEQLAHYKARKNGSGAG